MNASMSVIVSGDGTMTTDEECPVGGRLFCGTGYVRVIFTHGRFLR